MIIGEAAGVAASLAVKSGQTVQQVDRLRLKQILQSRHAVLKWAPDSVESR